MSHHVSCTLGVPYMKGLMEWFIQGVYTLRQAIKLETR